jgi:hypothetical protein
VREFDRHKRGKTDRIEESTSEFSNYCRFDSQSKIEFVDDL